MNNAQMKYKRDTGKCFYVNIESRLVVDALDLRVFHGWEDKDILKAIDEEKPHWGIFCEELPRDYDDSGDVFLPTPEYVAWLEEQISGV